MCTEGRDVVKKMCNHHQRENFRVDSEFLIKLNSLILERYRNLCEDDEKENSEPVYDEIPSKNSEKQDDKVGSLFCFRIATASQRFMNY